MLSALGPKGQGIAAEIADGLMNVGPPEGEAADWHVHMVNGTVLDPGEVALRGEGRGSRGSVGGAVAPRGVAPCG